MKVASNIDRKMNLPTDESIDWVAVKGVKRLKVMCLKSFIRLSQNIWN